MVTADAAVLVGVADLAGRMQLARGPGCAIKLLAACLWQCCVSGESQKCI